MQYPLRFYPPRRCERMDHQIARLMGSRGHAVWSYFGIVRKVNPQGKQVEFSVCKIPSCKAGPNGGAMELKGSFSTNCVHHVNRHHPKEKEELENALKDWKPRNRKRDDDASLAPPSGPVQQSILGHIIGVPKMSSAKVRLLPKYDKKSEKAKRLDSKRTTFFLSTGTSFRTVRNEDFRGLLAELYPQYAVPTCHTTISKWVRGKNEELKERVMEVCHDRAQSS